MRIVAIVCCLCSSVLGSDHLELANDHASSIGGEVVRVEGVSMEPRLAENDLVIIVPVMWADLKQGDMVQFLVSDNIRSERKSLPTWIHQICLKEGDWIRTVGINNPELDPFWIHRGDVIGKVVAIYISSGKDLETVSDKAMNYFRSKTIRGNLSQY